VIVSLHPFNIVGKSVGSCSEEGLSSEFTKRKNPQRIKKKEDEEEGEINGARKEHLRRSINVESSIGREKTG